MMIPEWPIIRGMLLVSGGIFAFLSGLTAVGAMLIWMNGGVA